MYGFELFIIIERQTIQKRLASKFGHLLFCLSLKQHL